MMSGIRIIGTGSYLPERVVNNQTIARLIKRAGGGETGDDWIIPRTGIKERHFAHKRELNSDLAFKAAERALIQAGIGQDDLDLIRVCTVTPDANLPTVAARLQEKLGASGKHAPISDLNAACSGFIYGIQGMVAEMLWCRDYLYGLLVGSEVMSRHGIDLKDRGTAILFADGAGAVVLKKTFLKDKGVLRTIIHGDAIAGHLFDWPRNAGIKMQGNKVFKMAVKCIVEVSEKILKDGRYQIDDVDLFIAHQANERIIDATAAHLGIAPEKVVKTIGSHGNTSAASIPLALDFAIQEGRLKEGMLVLLAAVGGGLTWGAALIRW